MARRSKFSERVGGVQPRKAIQLKEPDAELKIRIWNVLDIHFRHSPIASDFVHEVWRDVLIRPINELLHVEEWDAFGGIFGNLTWTQFYDVVELAAFFHPLTLWPLQEALEVGGSGYRFIDGQLAPITNEQEVAELESALKASKGTLTTVGEHLQTSLDMLSDRDNPDYRNSIKEAVSALEALVNAILGKRESLGAALNDLEAKLGMGLHPALKTALSKIYGYTSDASGIRHALSDEKNPPDREDARFMLITVSAFVNLLLVKADKAKVKIK